MKNIIFCDLDGTLLDSNHQVDQTSIKEIKSFCDEGNGFIIATGRLDHDIKYIENEFNILGAYRISQNGALIKDHLDNIIYQKQIKKQASHKIIDFLMHLELRVEISSIDNRFFPSLRKVGEVAEYDDSSIVLNDFYVDAKRINVLTFLIFGEVNQFNVIREFINNNNDLECDCFMSSPSTLEIVAKGVNKGEAIKSLLTRMSDIKTSIALGDSENDISMYDKVDLSFAMNHAHDNNKAKAMYATSSVGEAIKFIKGGCKDV